MTTKPRVTLRRTDKSVPPGYIVGRSTDGVGPAELLSVSDIVRQATNQGAVVPANPGINQLTGDVAAGPGTGSQVATIQPLAVTTGKIADAAVTTAKLADLNVTTGKIADLAVTTGKIADAAVTTAKLATTAVTAGSYTNVSLTVGVDGRLTAVSSGAVPAAANPTATASDTAVNGTATTFMRSDAAPAIQKGSSSVFGLVKVDGSTITATSGVISAVASGGTPGGSDKSIQYNNGGAFGGIGPLTNGQLFIGSTGATSVAASLTAPAAGITITGGAGSVTFALGNDLAALEAMSGTGLVTRTAAETYAQRTITGPAAGISVSNGDGVAGNPTFALGNDLAALEGLAGTGIAVRTTTDTWAQRTITGTASKITVTNGDGVSGNPTITLPDTAVTAGSYTLTSLTVDQQGRLTAASSGSTTAISSLTSVSTLDLTSYIEVSEPTGGSPAYASKKTTIATVLSSGTPNPNLLINPFMEIDQVNEGAAISATAYVVDGWQLSKSSTAVVSVQRVADGPLSYSNSVKITVSTGAAVGSSDLLTLFQQLEAVNLSDTAFGSASAQSLALSFWVKSSIGSYTMCGSIRNGAASRSYPFNITITSANTWEKKTVIIPGDTTGTWDLASTSVGMSLFLTPAVGSTLQGTANTWAASNLFGTSSITNTILSTNGATFQISGVKLEVGGVVTSLRREPFESEMIRCQRYYRKSYPPGTVPGAITNAGMLYRIDFGYNSSQHTISFLTQFSPPMRTSPTVTWYSPVTGASGKAADFQSAADATASSQLTGAGEIVGSAQQTASTTAVQIGVQYTADARL